MTHGHLIEVVAPHADAFGHVLRLAEPVEEESRPEGRDHALDVIRGQDRW